LSGEPILDGPRSAAVVVNVADPEAAARASATREIPESATPVDGDKSKLKDATLMEHLHSRDQQDLATDGHGELAKLAKLAPDRWRRVALARIASLALLAPLPLAACTPTPTAAPSTPAPAQPRPQPQPKIPRGVAFTLAPVLEQGLLTALAVEIRWHTPRSGTSTLELPERWADARELWRHIEGFTVDGADSVTENGPTTRILTAEPGAPLVARDRVRSGYAQDPSSSDGQPFAPIVRPTWFHSFGEALFAVPDDDFDAPASFRWTGELPIASDLEHLAGARPGTVGDVLESVVIGGAKLQVHTVPEEQLRVATLGEYTFTRQAFIDLALAVITSERAFWGDHGEPFLITLAPQTKVVGRLSLGGTGRSDAFVLTVSEDAPLDSMRHLLAHEYFHTWNPRRLGGVPEGVPEGGDKWFSEGFTEFFTWRLLLRAGLYSLEDFAADWNAALLEYASSPARSEPNSRIVADYWNDRAISRLPYRRGPLLAALWEQRLRSATDGARDLDDVLLAMRDQVQAEPDAKVEAGRRFLAAYRELAGLDLAADYETFVVQGAPIELPADTFGACVRVETRPRRVFERGWDTEATSAAGNVITGLKRGSPAHRAGLRDGMQIVERIAGDSGDSTVATVLKVRDGERERRIKFMPEGEETLIVQQLVLPTVPHEQREACARALAGL